LRLPHLQSSSLFAALNWLPATGKTLADALLGPYPIGDTSEEKRGVADFEQPPKWQQ